MTDLSPRETAARALEDQHWDGTGCGDPRSPGACSNCFGPSPMTAREVADAVLAAVAAHDGLAEVLRGHTAWTTTGPYAGDTWHVTCYDCCATLAVYGPDDLHHREDSDFDDLFAAHLEAVVRAWIREQG